MLARKGQEAEWLQKELPALSARNSPLDLSFGCEFGYPNWRELHQEQDLKSRIERETSEEEKNKIRAELARKEIEKRTQAPALLAATAEKVGSLLTRFRIGDGESGYPARIVSSEQWCAFFAKCPNLEDVVLVSCYTADDAVLDALKDHPKLQKLTITGNDKISGSISNSIIDRLCASTSLQQSTSEEFSLSETQEDSGTKTEDCGMKKEAPEVKQDTLPGGSNSEELQNESKTGKVFFPALCHLVLTDQASISMTDFKKMKNRRPDIRFCYGQSGGYSMAASMLGFDCDYIFDTQPLTVRQYDQNYAEENSGGWYPDDYADDFYEEECFEGEDEFY